MGTFFCIIALYNRLRMQSNIILDFFSFCTEYIGNWVAG